MNNPYKGIKIEYHILQSFPVSCLNRDDVGAPKTAMVGGTVRARVSSQSWKRAVRTCMQEAGLSLGKRTRLIKQMICEACRAQGATEEQAKLCGKKIEGAFIKGSDTEKEDKELHTSVLIFLSPSEAKKLAEKFKEHGFNPEEVITQTVQKAAAKEVEAILGKPVFQVDGLDIALFGRMVADAPSMHVEAAASFSHAISTHRVGNEIDFFTALDDYAVDPGSAHMGSLEFNAATYYRYISLNLGQLWENTNGQQIEEMVESFTKALYLAVPIARQTTMSAASPWEFARICIRKGQRIQVPFETPVKKVDNGGFSESSKKELCDYLEKKEAISGSLYGKLAQFDFGEDAGFPIDQLITDMQKALPGDGS